MASFLSAFLIAVFGCAPAPVQKDAIRDDASLLTRDQKEWIETYHRKLQDQMDIRLVVQILKESPPDIDQKAALLFNELKVGEHTEGGKGVLFLIDPEGEEVRLEVGYSLEPVYTDAFIGTIERNQMAPFFRSGKVEEGILATVELLVQKALDQKQDWKEASDRPITPQTDGSGGGGAKTKAPILNAPPEKTALSDPHRFEAQPSPDRTLDLYMTVLERRIKDPRLGLYTSETRAFLRSWVVTDAQQAAELRQLQRNEPDRDIRVEGERAVIRFPIRNRQAAPYFFRKNDQGWMLDVASMSRTISFNHMNQWRFRTQDHEFMFAFQDVGFDRHGFPRVSQSD